MDMQMNRKTFLTLFLLGTVLRIVWVSVPPLWYDENFTLLLSRLPFREMLAATASDVHPPLWYIIEWLWMQIPHMPAWAIRVPALLCSIASLYLFGRMLKRDIVINDTVATVAMVFMAILPMQLWYAQEGRMYALLELEVIVALNAVMYRRWAILFPVSVAMLYTQNYGAFYLATLGLVALVMDINVRVFFFKHTKGLSIAFFQRTIVTAVVMISACAFYLPWAGIVASQMADIQGRYWIMDKSAGAILITLYKLFFTASVPGAFFFASYFVTFGLLVIGLSRFVKHHGLTNQITMVMAFAPIFMAWIVSLVWQPVLLFRPLIGVSPFLYIIAAWSFDSLQDLKPSTIAIPAMLVIPVLLSGLYGYYANINAMKGEGAVSSLRQALAYVDAHWQDGDILYATDDGPWINLAPYTTHPIYRMPGCAEKWSYAPVLGSLSEATRTALGMHVNDLDSIPHTRAWVFAPFSPLHPVCYREQVSAWTGDSPVYIVDDNDWLYSAVWMVSK